MFQPRRHLLSLSTAFFFLSFFLVSLGGSRPFFRSLFRSDFFSLSLSLVSDSFVRLLAPRVDGEFFFLRFSNNIIDPISSVYRGHLQFLVIEISHAFTQCSFAGFRINFCEAYVARSSITCLFPFPNSRILYFNPVDPPALKHLVHFNRSTAIPSRQDQQNRNDKSAIRDDPD